MSYFIKLKHLFFVLSLIGAAPAFATDPAMIYRGVALGDHLEKVKIQISNEVPRVTVSDTGVLKAGDDEGINSGCAYSQIVGFRKNCLLTNFYFSTEQKLLHIYIQQGFSTSISLKLLIEKLSNSYGSPKVILEKKIPASHPSNTAHITPASEMTSLIWGGLKTPTDYENSPFPGESMERIGGNFISASIYHQGNNVVGYSLRVMDTASVKEYSSNLLKELNRKAAERQRESEASVKF